LRFVLAVLSNWRNGLYFFLIWLLFEDFQEIPGQQHGDYFAKDV